MIPVGYKDRRAEGETLLRQCQLVQLHLLHVLDTVCKELGLTYCLEGGTALGAARHNGFIPWDDDLDVGMPMKDYKKFLKFARHHLPADVMLQDPKDFPFQVTPFAKLRDTRSFYCECTPNIATADPSGIYLDIFPYEQMPEIGKLPKRLLKQAISSTWYRTRYFRKLSARGFLAALIFAPVGFVCDLLHGCLRITHRLLLLVFPSRTTFLQLECIYHHQCNTADMFPLSKHRFEDDEFPVPRNLDSYLTNQYGDWRQIPPEDQRPRHARIIDPFHAAK